MMLMFRGLAVKLVRLISALGKRSSKGTVWGTTRGMFRRRNVFAERARQRWEDVGSEKEGLATSKCGETGADLMSWMFWSLPAE